MSIQLLKKGTNADSDMAQYEKSLRAHRLKVWALMAVLFFIVVCLFMGLQIYMENRTFETYEVVSSKERTDTMNTQYAEYLKYVLKYGKDGISCVDSNNKLIWSQPYNMQNPIIDVCKNSVALAEKSGTDAMIFDENGLVGTIQTLLPIHQISVSSQGVLAALLEDGDIMRLNLYNKKGEELVSSKFELQDAGYPLSMSLSTDATKLAVTFVQVQDGGVNTCLAFYNFDSVGENSEDHMVAAKTVSGVILPTVHYMDQQYCFAVGTELILIYEGKQIPELVAEIPVEEEIYSVFYSSKLIGIVVSGEEKKYALQVYDTQGKMKFKTEFDQEYHTLKFSGVNILIYNDTECTIMNQRGKIIFTQTFEESISNMYTKSGRARYIVMHASKTDSIRLR